MVNIQELKKERGYEDITEYPPGTTPFYAATRYVSKDKKIEFLVCKKTFKQYFIEKWYKRIPLISYWMYIHSQKWWLEFKISIDFKTMELKWIQEFTNFFWE